MMLRIVPMIATAVLTATAIALVFRGALFGTGPISIALQLVGLALAFWARFTFGLRSFTYSANPTAGPLVTRGPYRYIRNPIYAAAWLIIWTGVAMHWSRANAVLAAIVAVMLLIRIACEEPLLRITYPEYAEYSRKTARLIPFLV